MAKKSRRAKLSENSLLKWPKILVVIIPLFAAVLILFSSSNGRSVLGISDTNLPSLNHETKTASNSGESKNSCKRNRVTSFFVSTLCGTGNGFKKFSYTCENGTSATVTKTCINTQAAFEAAVKGCAKSSKCIKSNPTPTRSPFSSPTPTRAEPTPTPSR
jgi:hypothetical protein